MTIKSLESILKRGNSFFDLDGKKLKVEEISFEYIPVSIFARAESQDTPEILYTLAPKKANAYNFNSSAKINKKINPEPSNIDSPRYQNYYLVGFYYIVRRGINS